MYLESVKATSMQAQRKVLFLEKSKISYLIAAILAGAYIGMGIVLIFSIGAPFAAVGERKSTRRNSSHIPLYRMPSSA